MRNKFGFIKPAALLFGTVVTLVVASCVTINVYFPEAQAEQAASRFIGGVWGGETGAQAQEPETESAKPLGEDPQAYNASVLDFFIGTAYAQEGIDITTPAIQAIQERMQQRFSRALKPYYESGAIGLTGDALVAVRDLSSVPLPKRNQVNQLVAEENADRRAAYREIAVANGHPEWESRIRSIFADKWIAKAQPGWWYETASGTWVQK